MAFPPLPDQVSADLYSHLAVMERSGLSPVKAFSLLNLPAALQARVSAVRRMLDKGLDIPTAGLKSGLFSELDTHILRAACNAGSPETSYKRLAARYGQKARLAGMVRSRMAMPLLVLLIAVAVQPLPGLVSGQIGAAGYLLSIIRPFLVLAGCVVVYRHLAGRVALVTDRPGSVQMELSAMLPRVPLFGNMVVRKNVRDFYENLAMLLEAGIPMFDALPLAVRSVGLYTVRADFARVQPLMEKGLSLSEAVAKLHFQGRYPVQDFVITGETSGSLPEMLLRFADAESQAVAQFQVQLADWLPRLFYFGVAGWMAYQILNQHII